VDHAGPVWYGRTATGSTTGLTAFVSPEFPDGRVVDTETLPAGALDGAVELWRAQFDPAIRRLVWVDPMADAPVMWFVHQSEDAADPPAVTLVAFAGGQLPAGTVTGAIGFQATGADPADQVGAIRWWPATGQVHQIYVQPLWRRRRVGTALLHAASAQQVALGTGARLWAGGERTDLGESFAAGLPYDHRVAPRSRRVAAMTPPDRAEGVPDRLLVPDP
jgi:GNAT superfamily N-acetyltransferase